MSSQMAEFGPLRVRMSAELKERKRGHGGLLPAPETKNSGCSQAAE